MVIDVWRGKVMDIKLQQDNIKKARVDEVLRQAKQEGRGKLTIFLGAAAA